MAAQCTAAWASANHQHSTCWPAHSVFPYLSCLCAPADWVGLTNAAAMCDCCPPPPAAMEPWLQVDYSGEEAQKALDQGIIGQVRVVLLELPSVCKAGEERVVQQGGGRQVEACLHLGSNCGMYPACPGVPVARKGVHMWTCQSQHSAIFSGSKQSLVGARRWEAGCTGPSNLFPSFSVVVAGAERCQRWSRTLAALGAVHHNLGDCCGAVHELFPAYHNYYDQGPVHR